MLLVCACVCCLLMSLWIMIFQLLWVNPPLGFYYQKVVLRTRPLPTHTGVKCSLNYSYIFSARNCLSHSILHRHPPLCSCVRARASLLAVSLSSFASSSDMLWINLHLDFSSVFSRPRGPPLESVFKAGESAPRLAWSAPPQSFHPLTVYRGTRVVSSDFEKGTACALLLSELPDLGLSPGRIERQFSTRTSSHRDDTWEIR